MSQIIIPATPGNLPPSVPESFTTDVQDNTTSGPGNSVPVLHVLQIKGRETNQNNDNGIRTDSDPEGGNIIYVELTNRITGTVTTTDATPTTLVSLPMGTISGVYLVQGDITAYDVTDSEGAAYTFIGAAKTDGATGTEISVEAKDVFEEVAMAAADFTLGVTGNDAFISVQGIIGKTINWSCLFTYRFVS